MNDLTIEDFKNLLLDLYLAQRENAALHAQLVAQHQDADEGATDGE